MTAKDRWNQNLECKTCGRSGEAKVSQEDGWAFKNDQSTSVDFLPDGFGYTGGTGFNDPVRFFCETCNPKE